MLFMPSTMSLSSNGLASEVLMIESVTRHTRMARVASFIIQFNGYNEGYRISVNTRKRSLRKGFYFDHLAGQTHTQEVARNHSTKVQMISAIPPPVNIFL
jgi:hypothetical protein